MSTTITENVWSLLRFSSEDQRVWRADKTGSLYLTDHSGDGCGAPYGDNVGNPDQCSDGPLRIAVEEIRELKMAYEPSRAYGIRCHVPCFAEAHEDKRVKVSCQPAVGLFLAKLLKVPATLTIGSDTRTNDVERMVVLPFLDPLPYGRAQTYTLWEPARPELDLSEVNIENSL